MATLKNTAVFNEPLVLPSGTTAQRPSSPVDGATRFNTTLGYTEIYNNGSWQDLAGGSEGVDGNGSGATTIMYIPFYGDTASNADITDRISGTVATVSGTVTRGYTRGGYVGLDCQGGYVDIRSLVFERDPRTLNARRHWTVEFWVYRTGGTGAATFLEMNQYPYGLMLRDGNLATDHYWRGSTLNAGMTFTSGAWIHIAAVGYGPNIKIFENGTQKYDGMNAVGTSAFPDPFFQGSTVGLSLMCSNHTTRGAQAAYGTIRKFRVSLGARYFSNFTSSTVYPI